MSWLLFIFYTLLLGLALTRSRFVRSTGLATPWIAGLFGLRLVTGMLYGYLYTRNPDNLKNSDTWQIYLESLKEYRVLLHSPGRFFREWFANPDGLSLTDFFGSDHSYWNYLRDGFLIRTQALLNLITGGNYYADLVFYTFFTFLGCALFYRFLRRHYPGREVLLIGVAFLLPSFLFWTSGMYKDGYLFCCLALIVDREPGRQKNFLPALLAWLVLLLLRNYIALLMVPAYGCWALIRRYPRRGLYYSLGVYLVCVLGVLFSGRISHAVDFPRLISQRRAEFLQLPARTSISSRQLEPSPEGLAELFPLAAGQGLLRPHPFENKGWAYIVFGWELMTCWALVALAIFRRRQFTGEQRAFFLFALLLCGSCWLFMGYTAPVLGALVRYRSIFFPLLAGACLPALSNLRIK